MSNPTTLYLQRTLVPFDPNGSDELSANFGVDTYPVFLLKFSAYEDNSMTEKLHVFVYQLETIDAEEEDQSGFFTHITSPADYQELQIYNPSSGFPFADPYNATQARFSQVSFYCRSKEEVQFIDSEIQKDLSKFIKANTILNSPPPYSDQVSGITIT